MTTSDLKLYKKTEQLLYDIYPRLINFPKSEKFALSEYIKKEFFELLKNISLANSVKSRRMMYAQTADGHLQTLKVLVKLSKERKYLSKGFFEVIDLKLTELSKMLAGYIRAINK